MRAVILGWAMALLLATAPAIAARFDGWNAQAHRVLIADQPGKPALYEAAAPGETLHPLWSEAEPLTWASWAPRKGDVLAVAKAGDIYALADGHLTLLSDGKGHATPNAWSHDGHWLAYISGGADEAIRMVDPRDAKSDRLVAQLKGKGWAVLDFTADGTSAVVAHRLPKGQVALFFMDVAGGAMRPIGKPAAYGNALFSYDGVLWATLAGRLGMVDEGGGAFTPVAPDKTGVSAFDVSLDGKLVAYVAGSTLKLLDTHSGQTRAVPGVSGAIGAPHFAPGGVLGFDADGQVFTLDTATMALTSWTH